MQVNDVKQLENRPEESLAISFHSYNQINDLTDHWDYAKETSFRGITKTIQKEKILMSFSLITTKQLKRELKDSWHFPPVPM